MKITDKNLFPCEQFSAKLASERLAALARQQLAEIAQEKADKKEDDAAFWKAVYILMHIVGLLVVLTMIYEFWGQ